MVLDPAAATPAPADDAGEGAETPGENKQGFVIEISCLPDGSFEVSSSPLEEEAQEEGGDPGSEAGKPAKSFGEALKIALQLYQNDGEDEDAQMAAGYNGAGAQPPESVPMTENTDMAARN